MTKAGLGGYLSNPRSEPELTPQELDQIVSEYWKLVEIGDKVAFYAWINALREKRPSLRERYRAESAWRDGRKRLRR